MEFLLCGLIVLLAVIPFAMNVRRRGGRSVVVVAAVGLMFGVTGLTWSPSQDFQLENYIPERVKNDGYVSSTSCRACHPDHYASWHRTYHRTMTQLATPDTVLASFDGVKLQSRGRTYELSRRGDEFWVHMADPDWEAARLKQGYDLDESSPSMVDRRVLMTTGSHNLQTYWVPSKFGNQMRQFPWYFHIADQRWIPSEDSFLEPPDGERHFDVWNKACIHCHSVAGRPLYDPGINEPHSQIAEFGISCESCHGPGEKHMQFHRSPLNRYQRHWDQKQDNTIVNPAKLDSKAKSHVCAQCHATFGNIEMELWMHGLGFRVGEDFHKKHKVKRLRDGLSAEKAQSFWGDGTCRVGGDEYNSLIESPCFQRGELSCLSCHSMHHSEPHDQLAARMKTNHACLQCHKKFRDNIEAHTHHPAVSSGSLCYNCHMPNTTYALLGAMRSHRIDSPSVAISVNTGRPNACNLCHLDKTLKWTSQQLSDWYGIESAELSDDDQTIAASLTWLLQGNAVQRAVTSWHFGWEPAHEASGTDWKAPFLAGLLEDRYSAVRYVAQHALRKLPGYAKLDYDFVGPKEDRARARQQVLEQWGAEERSAGRDWTSLLVSPDGKLRRVVIDRLLNERDDPDMRIPE